MTSTFATGNQARAVHQGAFVWADSTNAAFASTGVNQFLIRANGGVAGFADAAVGAGKTVTLVGAALAGSAAGNYDLTSVGTATAAITQRFPNSTRK